MESNRRNFTILLTRLLQTMIDNGDQPIIDFVLRSREEQNRLFKLGLSKLDGFEKLSQHNRGKAADIYLVENLPNGGIIVRFEWSWEKAVYYHKLWEEWGGSPMINWDLGHYQI